MIVLSGDNLKEILLSSEKSIVLFGSSQCGFCRKALPIFDRISNEFYNIKFIGVDLELNPKSRELIQINRIPTLGIFFKNELISSVEGASEDNIRKMVNLLI